MSSQMTTETDIYSDFEIFPVDENIGGRLAAVPQDALIAVAGITSKTLYSLSCNPYQRELCRQGLHVPVEATSGHKINNLADRETIEMYLYLAKLEIDRFSREGSFLPHPLCYLPQAQRDRDYLWAIFKKFSFVCETRPYLQITLPVGLIWHRIQEVQPKVVIARPRVAAELKSLKSLELKEAPYKIENSVES